MTEVDKAQDALLARTVADGGRVGALVLALWQRTRMDWGFVSERVSVTFRRERWLGSSERRFVAETVYGLVRHLRRIDAAIAAGSRRTVPPKDEQRLLAYLVLECGLPPEAAAAREPELDWSVVKGIDEAIARERKPAARIALACSLPDWLAEALVHDWGDQAEPLARALNQRAPMTIRSNALHGTREALAEKLAKDGIETHAGKLAPDALIVDTRTNLFGLAAFRAGDFEAQDEGSQMLARLVDPKGTIIDLCAGAGGKTLAIAGAMKNKGRIFASDVDERKLEELRKRARRAGVTNTQTVAPDDLRKGADRVLVDAPCSGVGSLRRNPEARWRLREDELPRLADTQRTLLARAAELIVPDGRIVYGTCTLLRGENEDVVRASGLEVVSEHHWLPHVDGTDGFYGAVLRRRPQ